MQKIVYIDMDDTLCDFQSSYKHSRKTNPDIKFPQSIKGFFQNLAPLPGAIDVFHWLNDHPSIDVYILTAPSIKNPLCYVEKRLWVEENLGFKVVNQLIISPHKNLSKGDYLIDDYTKGKGQESFEGELIHFGSEEFSGWEEIKTHFQDLLNNSVMNKTNQHHHSSILCFRAYDMRDHFPEPIETFRQALELLQSDRAYLPEESARITCYLNNEKSIQIPDSFYRIEVPRFDNEDEARDWIVTRDDDIKSGASWPAFGLVVADPNLPIEDQIKQALAYSDTEVVGSSENDRICVEVDTWLNAAISAMPLTVESHKKSQRLKNMRAALKDLPSENSKNKDSGDSDHSEEFVLNEPPKDDDLVDFLKDMQAKQNNPARWVITSRDYVLTEVCGNAYFDLVNDRWVPDISDASCIKERKIADVVVASFDSECLVSVVQHFISQKELAKTAIKFEQDPKVITYHAESGTYLYEEHNRFSDCETHALISMRNPEQFAIEKVTAGSEQLFVSIPDTAMDEVAIAWCKHRKLQGALGGPVGKEWGSPDCDYD